MRFVSTDPSGCGATVAHVLWEPHGGLRRTLGHPEHHGPSGEGTEYCAVREHGLGGLPACGVTLAEDR